MNLNFVIRFTVGFLLAAIVMAAPNDCFGQRRSKGPAVGDIIRYDQANSGIKYGLVTNVRNNVMTVERVDGNDFDEDRLIASTVLRWEIVDSMNKPETRLRLWKSGKFEIKAKLVSIEGDQARLEKSDGKQVTIEIDKLSERDRKYILASGIKDVDEAEDFPHEVLVLMDRRDELMGESNRHQRLAKLSPQLMLGDIIRYKRFRGGFGYGIISSLGFFGKMDVINEKGDFKQESHPRSWYFYDREMVAIPLDDRMWNSANGKFNIKARLVAVDDEVLTLLKTDGDKVKTPMSKLSKIDQNYARRVRNRLNVRNDEELVREREDYDDELQRLLARREDILKRATANILAAKDASKMKGIQLSTRTIELSSDELKPLGMGRDTFSFTFPLRVPDHSRVENVCYSKQSGFMAMVAGSPFRGKPTLAVVDTRNEEVYTNIDSDEVGSRGQAIALSPSGRTILIYSGWGFNHNLELWRNENGRLTRQSVISYDSSFDPHAHLFSDEQGVILNSDGNLVFFDLTDRIIPTHIIPGDRFNKGRFDVSENQRYVFYHDAESNAFFVIDADARKCVGGMSLQSSERFGRSSFVQVNSDGKTLTEVKSKKLTIYSLATGKPIETRELPQTVMTHSSSVRSNFQYLTPDLVMLFGGDIYDLKLGVEVASVSNFTGFGFGAQYFSDLTRLVGGMGAIPSKGAGGFGNSLGAANPSSMRSIRDEGDYSVQQGEVSVQRLPADEIIAHANSLAAADIIDFGSDDTLSLTFDIQGSSSRIEEQLRSKIQGIMSEGGITVSSRSDYVLELKYKVGRTETRTYQIVGEAKPRIRKVNFVPKSVSAQLKYRGEVIWSRGESANLGRPFDEGDLNERISKSQSISASRLLEFNYPTEVRVLTPSKKRKFSWQ